MTASATVGVVALDARQRWFGIDAVITGANALGYLALASWLSDQLGATAGMYRTVGGALLLFAIAVGVYAASSRAPRWAGWSIAAGNAAWVVASLVVATAGIGDFNGIARSWIACQAVVVAALTVMQMATIRER